MLLGALVGALLVLKVKSWTALAAAVLLMAGVAAAAPNVTPEPTG
jgi:hypothetical protein